ncbi:hypothetical protein RCL1_000195 [Eukaryota sp. TZLM3-RCL]
MPPKKSSFKYIVPDDSSGETISDFSSHQPSSFTSDTSYAESSSEVSSSMDDVDFSFKLTPEQEQVVQLASQGQSFLVSGGAGTGKSFVLRHVVDTLRQKYGPDVYVTASTGIAAVQISGITVHSFAGIGLGNNTTPELVKSMSAKARKRWKSTKCLIIDEISMVDSELLDKLEEIARFMKSNERPFGGIQLILFGDFLQLPPVKSNRADPFAFEASCWPRVISQCVELRTVIRQKDPVFVALLRLVRLGMTDPPVIQLLTRLTKESKQHVLPSPSSDEIEHTLLYCTNRDVDSENSRRLDALPDDDVRAFDAIDHGPEITKYSNQLNQFVPKKITLKVGAQVMLLKNLNVSSSLCNGARGVVVGFETRVPKVKFASGEVCKVDLADFVVEENNKTVATRRQVPLKLAWSITIHKSQGMTIEKMAASLNNVFECAQCYVALSRCPSLQNLNLLDFNQRAIKVHPKAIQWLHMISPNLYSDAHRDLSIISSYLRGPDAFNSVALQLGIVYDPETVNYFDDVVPPHKQKRTEDSHLLPAPSSTSIYDFCVTRSRLLNVSSLRCPQHKSGVYRCCIEEGNDPGRVFFMCKFFPPCNFSMLFPQFVAPQTVAPMENDDTDWSRYLLTDATLPIDEPF